MSYVNSIAGNQWFTGVADTRVNSQNVNTALNFARLAPLSFVEGTVTPTVAANYAVVDSNGANVVLPPNSLVTNVLLQGTTTLAGGTNALPVLAATAGGGAGTVLTAAVVTADLLTGSVPAVLPTTGSSTDVYLSLTTTGIYTAGSIKVRVYFHVFGSPVIQSAY